MRVLEPYTVTVLTTSKCTAACRHCSMNSSPERNDRLSWEQLESTLTQLFQEAEIAVVVFSGGESTLLGEDLNKALRLCKQRGAITRLVTNAFWATSDEAALAKLTELRQAGLDELNISTDDYHLPYISLERVRRAFQAAKKLDFMTVALCNAYGPESWLTPERLNAEFGEGEQLMRRFDEDGRTIKHERKVGETMILLSNGVSMQLGRGVEGLQESEVQQTPREELIGIGDLIGGCPWAVRSAAISPKGHFVSCCGFEVEDNPILDYGDLSKHSLKELMDRADNDLITNMIAFVGPIKLMELLQKIAPGETSFPRKSYRSYCEVCEDLVRIKQNRDALYRYQAVFIDAVTKIREFYTQQHGKDGRVRIPPAVSGKFLFSFSDGEQVPVPTLQLSADGALVAAETAAASPVDSVGAPGRKRSLPVLPP